jgi:hypothetical protein
MITDPYLNFDPLISIPDPDWRDWVVFQAAKYSRYFSLTPFNHAEPDFNRTEITNSRTLFPDKFNWQSFSALQEELKSKFNFNSNQTLWYSAFKHNLYISAQVLPIRTWSAKNPFSFRKIFDETSYDWNSIIEKEDAARWDAFFKNLNFKTVSRAIAFIQLPDTVEPAHRDWSGSDWLDGTSHFMWIKITEGKRFWIRYNNEKVYVESTFSMFNLDAVHGADPVPYPSISLRIDGQFTEEFCKKIGVKYTERSDSWYQKN